MRGKITRFIAILIGSDILFHSGWGLINPIFALFVTEKVVGGNITMVGFLAATYWIAKSSVQPFFAHFFDKNQGELDDYRYLVSSMYIVSFVPLGYLLVQHVWQLFVVQALYGVVMGVVVPTWYGMFTRHLKKGWEAFSWSMQSTSLGFAAGFAAAFGSAIAGAFGFQAILIIVSAMSFLAATSLLILRKHIQLQEL